MGIRKRKGKKIIKKKPKLLVGSLLCVITGFMIFFPSSVMGGPWDNVLAVIKNYTNKDIKFDLSDEVSGDKGIVNVPRYDNGKPGEGMVNHLEIFTSAKSREDSATWDFSINNGPPVSMYYYFDSGKTQHEYYPLMLYFDKKEAMKYPELSFSASENNVQDPPTVTISIKYANPLDVVFFNKTDDQTATINGTASIEKTSRKFEINKESPSLNGLKYTTVTLPLGHATDGSSTTGTLTIIRENDGAIVNLQYTTYVYGPNYDQVFIHGGEKSLTYDKDATLKIKQPYVFTNIYGPRLAIPILKQKVLKL
jgi:hypothetical protein